MLGANAPGNFFWLALVAALVLVVAVYLQWLVLFMFALLTLVLAVLVMFWEWAMYLLGLIEGDENRPYPDGQCPHCGHKHFLWPWSK